MPAAQKLDNWETLATGLAMGLLAHAAPVVAAAMLAVALARLFRADAHTDKPENLAPLAALGGVACAAMIGGAHATIAAALVWRTGVEVLARRGDLRTTDLAANVHLFSAPAAALLYRLGAPDLLVIAALCFAGVAWADWLIRHLADWRLDAADGGGARMFVVAQVATLAPLLIFPSPQTCLAALVAMGAARAITWQAPVVGGYAAAR
jgi:hypothetical protein